MSQTEIDLLIIDDDPEILHLLREAFAEQSLTVETAEGFGRTHAHLRHHLRHLRIV